MRPAGIPEMDFASSDICVSLGLSQTNFYALASFGKGISLMFHLLAQALTVERTVIGRPPSQCCQMHDHYPPRTIILSIWYDTSPFPIFQRPLPRDEVSSFSQQHMTSAC